MFRLFAFFYEGNNQSVETLESIFNKIFDVMKTLIFFIGFVLVISACNKNSNDNPQTSIRVMNASPNATSVDLAPDGKVLISAVKYGFVSDYFKVDAGGFNIRMNLVGSQLPFTNTDIVLDADKNYTIVIADSISRLKQSLIIDNLSDPPSDKSFVRFFHLVGNGPAVDLFKGGTAVFSGRVFNDQSTGTGVNYTAIDPGTQTFEVRSNSSGSIISLLSNVNLVAGKIYTIVVRGFVGGAGSQGVVMTIYIDK